MTGETNNVESLLMETRCEAMGRAQQSCSQRASQACSAAGPMSAVAMGCSTGLAQQAGMWLRCDVLLDPLQCSAPLNLSRRGCCCVPDYRQCQHGKGCACGLHSSSLLPSRRDTWMALGLTSGWIVLCRTALRQARRLSLRPILSRILMPSRHAMHWATPLLQA